ncbi:MAG: hypothetical protein EB127_31850, partial [Alphaproteobacteria bacterium]|nr:hypothetical protein [Alphaproteobacteria bacterium]
LGILAFAAFAIVVASVVIGIGALVDQYNATGLKPEDADSANLIQIVNPDALKYNIYYSTIWDIFEEMTYRHPGYVKHPRIYYKSNRMTMFFGLPDQNMWESAGDPIDTFRANKIFKEMAREAEQTFRETYGVGEASIDGDANIQEQRYVTAAGRSTTSENRANRILDNDWSPSDDERNQGRKLYVDSKKLSEFLRLAKRRFKPFRKWHNVNSYTDIINNDIEATSEGWFTEVQIQYTYVPMFGWVDTASEDAAGKLDGQTKIYDPNSLAKWSPSNVVSKKANVDLPPNYVRSTSYQFINCKSIGLAKTYARSILGKQAKDMYKGSLTIMGNPYIRPYDV